MNLSYIINELGEDREQYFNAVSPPIMQASNFAFNTIDELSKAFADEMGSYLYSRGLNPTVDILRKKLAALDGAEDCLVFNNGAAATFAAVMANVKSGDHIVSVKDPYVWTKKAFDNIFSRFGVSTTYIEGKDIQEWQSATQSNTVLYYLESPNSWEYGLQPLQEIADFAKTKNIITIIDNTYCTPIYQNVIEMGIDIAMQTATKYIGGHSDTLGGVLCGSHAMMRKIFESEYMTIGSGIQPFNAWAFIRGLRTLPARLERINQTTKTIVEFLSNHPKVEKIIFPFHPSFPQYELAKKQMKEAFGLVTIILKDKKRDSIIRFCESLKAFLIAVSWGGHESLVIPRCAGIRKEHYNPESEKHRQIRLYFGLEDADYLIKDFEQALKWVDG
ncbi:MAG TPA: PLP-dependent aspartate aminotransferase family protein [Niabella sp.]|nr:PLP-dependent aspartate aminotransferase family protein [Niabella sp.]